MKNIEKIAMENKYNNSTKISLDEAIKKFRMLYVAETEDYIEIDDTRMIKEIPKEYHVFGTEMEQMKISAYDIVENACEELFEDAMDFVYNINDLQKFIDYWIEQNARGADTYYPDYKYGVILK